MYNMHMQLIYISMYMYNIVRLAATGSVVRSGSGLRRPPNTLALGSSESHARATHYNRRMRPGCDGASSSLGRQAESLRSDSMLSADAALRSWLASGFQGFEFADRRRWDIYPIDGTAFRAG